MKTEADLLKIYKMGAEVLNKKAEDLSQINGETVQLVQQMALTMVHAIGIGLAAPQVGRSIQLAIVDPTIGENPENMMILVNPTILEAEGDEPGEEGCLSIPTFTLEVNRHTRLLLKYFDLDGKEHQREFSDYLARIIQHEIDHLNGILIADHVSTLKRQMLKKQVKKLQRNGTWE